MQVVKFHDKLEDIGAIIGIDLARYHTGTCVFVPGRGFTEFLPITVKNTEDNKELSLFVQLQELFEKTKAKYGKKIMVIQEREPQQCGKFTTAATLCGLARAHAILHLAVQMTEGVELYDEDGIHSTSVKSLFKTDKNPKPQKEDIRAALVALYDLDDSLLTDDISDAIAVVHTLLTKKWNADIDEQIKTLKKEMKKLKATRAIESRQAEINRLLEMKI